MPDSFSHSTRIRLTETDVYRAASEGVINRTDADRLVQWAAEQSIAANDSRPVEANRGLNMVTVAYFSGAILVLAACAWFLADRWEQLGPRRVFAVAIVYTVVALASGWQLRKRGFVLAGGLLISVSVALVPLLAYSIEDMLGFSPVKRDAIHSEFDPLVNILWLAIILSTIAASAVALRNVRFSFLVAPIVVSIWYLAINVACLLFRQNILTEKRGEWTSVIVGLVILVAGYTIERRLQRWERNRYEDYAFWCYLFGMLAFSGGVIGLQGGSELKWFVYFLINVSFLGIGVWLRRATVLVFGAIGTFVYLGHLAYEVFKNSIFFPFALALIGLSMILFTVFMQRRMTASKGGSQRPSGMGISV